MFSLAPVSSAIKAITANPYRAFCGVTGLALVALTAWRLSSSGGSLRGRVSPQRRQQHGSQPPRTASSMSHTSITGVPAETERPPYYFLDVDHSSGGMPQRPDELSELSYCNCKLSETRSEIEQKIVADYTDGTLLIEDGVFLGIGAGLCLQEVILVEKLMNAGATFSRMVLIDQEYKEDSLYNSWKKMQCQLQSWAASHRIEAVFYPSIPEYAKKLHDQSEPQASIAVSIDPGLLNREFLTVAESWNHQLYVEPRGMHYIGKFEIEVLGIHRASIRPIGEYVVIDVKYRPFSFGRSPSNERHMQIVRKPGADFESKMEVRWYDSEWVEHDQREPITNTITEEQAALIDEKLQTSVWQSGHPAYIT